MKSLWLKKEEKNRELIVFFNGWGFDADVVKDLDTNGFDILIVYDYRNFDFNFSLINLKKYEKKHLICWSMGVMTSNLFSKTFENFDTKIAINGTPNMIDDEFGIPKRIFALTLKRFSEESAQKFAQNMFNNGEILISPKRNFSELKQELESLNSVNIDTPMKFDKAYISTEDKIIPAKNQLNYWLNKTSTQLLNAPHYPFNQFKSWNDIL